MLLRYIVFSISILFSEAAFCAEVLYEDIHQKNIDFTFIPMSDLYASANSGDVKAQYLIALHKVKSKTEKSEGIKELEQLASLDILDAKNSLYIISKQVGNDSLPVEKALKYLQEAANEGYVASQVELAKIYNKGKYVSKDLQKYHYWAEKAAEQGHPDALAYTASDYYAGRGVPKNDTKGFEWLMRAYNVLGKDFERWSMLADAYENGLGTQVDLVKAYMCYDLEGSAGIEDKARIAPRMTAAQRAEGLRLSQEWQQKNHVYTMQSLGLKRQKDGSYQ